MYFIVEYNDYKYNYRYIILWKSNNKLTLTCFLMCVYFNIEHIMYSLNIIDLGDLGFI